MLEIRNQKLTTLTVTKRDGSHEPFAFNHIQTSLKQVTEASDALDQVQTEIGQIISDRFDAVVATDEIAAVITEVLNEHAMAAIADRYQEHLERQRLAKSGATDINHTIDRLLNRDESVVNENANKDSKVFNTQRDLTAGTVAKAIGLKMLPPRVANAHLNGDIHWHDLDYQPYSPMTNCCLIDFKEMLTNGFKIGNAEVETPHSIQTATAQMSQIIANVASSQYGGCSADRVDQLLAPFAEKNYQKHLADAQQWVDGADKQAAYAKQKNAKGHLRCHARPRV